MDKRFGKLLFFILLIACIMVPASSLANEYPNILRFHVIANSDSDEDQQLKLKVRDYVLERLQPEIMEDFQDSEENLDFTEYSQEAIRSYIKENMSRITTWAEEAVASEGYDYGVNCSLGVRHIPAKYYDDLFFPEGNYEALTISIGEGKGQNWWCVVFPPLCLISSQQSETEFKSEKVESSIADEEKLILKSKTMDLLKGNESVSRSSIEESLKCLFEKC